MTKIPDDYRPQDLDLPKTNGWNNLTPQEIADEQLRAFQQARGRLDPSAPAPYSPDLGTLEKGIDDPLWPIAQLIRALPTEYLWRLCEEMGKPDMAKPLVQWSISHIDGTPMPKEERRA